jgi:hypothetical protein
MSPVGTYLLVVGVLLIALPVVGIAYLRPRCRRSGKAMTTPISAGEATAAVVGAAAGVVAVAFVSVGAALAIGALSSLIARQVWVNARQRS